MRHATAEELSEIDGIGEVIAKAFVDYFSDGKNNEMFANLLQEVRIVREVIDESEQILDGKTLNHFGSRNELKDLIEKKGGKVAGSVSARTACLINNDAASNSSKNKKAKELNVPILTEEQFMTEYLGMEISIG